MTNNFKKATKKQAKLRLALFGVSGAGKTYSALRLATGLTGEKGKIAVIDTENKTACKYSNKFDFDVCECEMPSINNIMLLLKEAAEYDVLIIDSLTHAWDELIEEVNRIAKTKFGGNSWSAWSEGTPKQRLFIKALMSFKGHLIVTMRSETSWEIQENDKGKKVPVRIGTAPKQGKNIEYEFDMLMRLNSDHSAYILKDRTGKYQDECISLINEDLGVELKDWLNEGEPLPDPNADFGILQGLKATDTTNNAHQYYLNYQNKAQNPETFKQAYIIHYKELKKKEEQLNGN